MDELVCPNGHKNRPDATYCAVCLLPLTQAASPDEAAKVSRPLPARSRWSAAPTQAPTPPATRYSRYAPVEASAAEPLATAAAQAPAAEPLATVAAQAPAMAAPARKQRRRWPWVLAGLLVLILVAACALLTFVVPQRLYRQAETSLAVTAVGDEPSDAGISESEPPVAVATTVLSTATEIPPTATPADTATPFPTITPIPTSTPLVGVVLAPPTAIIALPLEPGAVNLLQNGEFARDWADGWTREAGELNGEEVIEVRELSDEVPVRGLLLEKTGAGSLSLVQHVVLAEPVEDTVFRGRVRLSGSAGETAMEEGRSALLIIYEAADGRPLGATAWMNGPGDDSSLWGTAPLPERGPLLDHSFLPDGQWQPLEVVLGDVLAERLPDVDAESVRQISIMLLLLGGESCPPDACRAALEATGLQVVALPKSE